MNPCKCGYYGDPSGKCTCSAGQIQKYLSRIQGTVMIGCSEVEVQYKDIVEKPDCFRDANETELINAFKVLGYGEE